MAQKCALIVDDSKTARRFLGTLLRRHGIRVESAASAEAALEFLGDMRPDVIFMDHMMPGMDGFEAVRAIKNNPATATIPIMMYTSQEGELYVGQARALGAVGVLPKQIKPVEVSAILESLHLIPTVDEVVQDEVIDADVLEAARKRPMPSVERMMEPADWGELHGWFEEMLNHHGRSLRGDIEKSVARLLDQRMQRSEAQEDVLPPPAADTSLKNRLNVLTALTVLLGFLAATFFWQQMDMRNKWKSASMQNESLLQALGERQKVAREYSEPIAEAKPQSGFLGPTEVDDFIETLEWTVNQFANYESGAVPLSDERLVSIDNLVSRLRSIGFGGVIQIDSHVGDFCYVQTATGEYELAPADLPVDQCDRVGSSGADALAMSAKQSVGFANYVAAINIQENAPIQIEVDAHGNSIPSFPYPATVEGISASEWNRIAGQNNRVLVSLVPTSTNYSADINTVNR